MNYDTSPLQLYFSLFILLSYLLLINGDVPLRCENNYCRNGGTCFLTSESIDEGRCNDEETYYDGKCYQLFIEPLTWDLASNRCRGHLITVEREDDRNFFSQFLQIKMSNLSAPFRNIGIWTAGHSVLNFTQPTYVWKPEHYLITKYYWQNNEPNIYADYTNVCIYIDERSLYLEWATTLCTNEKYYMCQRNVKDTTTKKMLTQCYCSNGYYGESCELSFHQEVPSQEIVCSDEKFEFACRSEERIHVDFALYGSIGTIPSQCLRLVQPDLSILETDSCVCPASLQMIIALCEGLQQCSVSPLSKYFKEPPCFGVPNSLIYRLRCVDDIRLKCRDNTFYQNGRCYAVNFVEAKHHRLTWEQAKQQCHKKGGLLASTIDEAVHNQIVSRARAYSQMPSDYWIAVWTNDMSDIIVGEDKNLTFVPGDSTIVGANKCVTYKLNTEKAFWMSEDCNDTKNWICEFAPNRASVNSEIYKEPRPERQVFMGTSPVDTTNLKDNRAFCAETTWNGLVFPRTPACSDAVQPCPNPKLIAGVVMLRCDCDAVTWEAEPNTNNCTHRWINELSVAIERGDPAESISLNWSTELRQTLDNNMYGGDIVGSLGIGQQLLPLARQQFAVISDAVERSQRAYIFTKQFGEVGDLLLDNRSERVWLSFEVNKRFSQASVLMSLLEQTAALMADYLTEDQKRIGYENWAMEVHIKKQMSSANTFNSDIVTRSRISFNTIPQASPTNEDRTTEDTSRQTVSFSNYTLSPIMEIPSFDVLQQSVQSPVAGYATPQEDTPTMRIASVAMQPTSIRLGYYLFNSLGLLLRPNENTIVNSLVIGASVNDPTESLRLPASSPVSFVFYHIKITGVSNPRCVYWDTVTNSWSQEGCTLLGTSEYSTNCSCNHLTSFAILMDITGSLEESLDEMSAGVLNVISVFGCAISIICLFFAFLIFTSFRSLWNVRNTIHWNLCLCLLIAELLFVIGIDRTSIKELCSAIAVVLHYVFLCAFCWMLLEGYQLYLMLIQVFEPDNVKILLYYLWSYGFPAVIVAVSAGVAWQNYGTSDYCWLNVDTSIIWAFAGPVLVVIIANVIFLGIAFKVVLSVKSRDRSRVNRIFGWLKGSATLLCLLGVTWIFGFLTAVNNASLIFAYIFTILNCTQGVFIFVLHVLLNEKVRASVMRFLQTGICCLSDRSSGYNSRSYISSKQKFLDMLKNSDSTNSDQQRSTNSTGLTPRVTPPSTPPNPLISPPPLGEYATNAKAKASVYKKRSNENKFDSEQLKLHNTILQEETKIKNFDGRANSMSNFKPDSYSANKNRETRRTAPVRRKKFPLGASEKERGSPSRDGSIIIERF